MATEIRSVGTAQFYLTWAAFWADQDNAGEYNAGDDVFGQQIDEELETESLTCSQGGTLGLASITMESAPGAEGDGTAAGEEATLLVDSNVTNCIDNITTTVPLTIQKLTFKKTSAGLASSLGMIAVTSNNCDLTMRRCLVYSTDDSSTDRGFFCTAAGADIDVANCAYYGWRSENVHENRTISGGSALWYNNTLWAGTDDGFEWSGTATGVFMRNCISAEGGGQDFDFGAGGPALDHDYNESNDATATGGNSDTSITAANEFVSTAPVNLHLKAGATALASGIGPGSDANVPTDDIDGNSRAGATCDRGWHEFTTPAGVDRKHYVLGGGILAL